MNGNFEWGVVITTFLSISSIVPCHTARLTDFLHPKLSKINAVLITPRLITPTLWRAGSIPTGTPRGGARCKNNMFLRVKQLLK